MKATNWAHVGFEHDPATSHCYSTDKQLQRNDMSQIANEYPTTSKLSTNCWHALHPIVKIGLPMGYVVAFCDCKSYAIMVYHVLITELLLAY